MLLSYLRELFHEMLEDIQDCGNFDDHSGNKTPDLLHQLLQEINSKHSIYRTQSDISLIKDNVKLNSYSERSCPFLNKVQENRSSNAYIYQSLKYL